MVDKIKKIGIIGVDSGQVVITDPSYIGNKKYGLPNYDKISEISDKKHQIKNKIGVSIAIASTTGVGDGVYPVYARIGKMGQWGTRVKSLTVIFDSAHSRKMMDAMLKRNLKKVY